MCKAVPGILFAIFLFAAPLSAARTYTVLPGHPRIYLRSTPWSGGLTVAEFKARNVDPRFTETVALLHASSPSGVKTTDILDLCALYFLTDSARYRDSALAQARILTLTGMDNTSETEIMGDVAVLYDWLYNELSLSDKATLRTNLKNMANAITAYLATAHYNTAYGTRTASYHLYHSRTYGCLKGLTLTGLALKNDDSAADGYLTQALALWDSVVVPANALSGGALTGGFGYHGYHAYFDILCALHAWKSAASLDLFAEDANLSAPWLRDRGLYMIYASNPREQTWLKEDDMWPSWIRLGPQARAMAAMAERAFPDGALGAFDAKITLDCGVGSNCQNVTESARPYAYLVFKDTAAPMTDYSALPTAKMFGPLGLGYCFLRNGWADNDVSIFYRCGDHLEDHGNYTQGSFTLARGKPLVIHGGAYFAFGDDHHNNYYQQAVSTNSVIFGPGYKQNHPSYQLSPDTASFNWFRLNRGLETGDILDFEASTDYDYIQSDVTAAWAPSQVTNYRRHLLFIDKKFLVVFDDILSASDTVKYLLHSVNMPAVNGALVTVTDTIKLWQKTLLPLLPVIQTVGGIGKEYWFADSNRVPSGADYDSFLLNPKSRAALHTGAWRIEIPQRAAGRIVYMNVIYAGNETETGFPDNPVLSTDNDSVKQVTLGARTATFRKQADNMFRFEGLSSRLEKTTLAVPRLSFSISPNPFTGRTALSLLLPAPVRDCRVEVYNTRGQRVRELFRGALAAGPRTLAWDGADASGRHAAAGVYLIQITLDRSLYVRKVHLVK
ncbi:MAG: FlgD immunoglobulin-like domain containing protein [Fibrobacterota bacterium]